MNELPTAIQPVRYGRGERRAARTRAAIVDAAEASFREHGYRGTRIEEIAAQADVAVGSIYTHFGSKDGLYHALAERSSVLFARYMEQAYTDDRTPLERVLAAGDAYLRFHLEHPGAFRFVAFAGVEAGPPALADDTIRDRTAALLARFEAEIEAAVATGEARPVDARQLSRFLWGAWNGVVALGLRTDMLALDEDEIAACIETGRRLVLEGLVAPAARDEAGDARARLVRIASPPEAPLSGR